MKITFYFCSKVLFVVTEDKVTLRRGWGKGKTCLKMYEITFTRKSAACAVIFIFN